MLQPASASTGTSSRVFLKPAETACFSRHEAQSTAQSKATSVCEQSPAGDRDAGCWLSPPRDGEQGCGSRVCGAGQGAAHCIWAPGILGKPGRTPGQARWPGSPANELLAWKGPKCT